MQMRKINNPRPPSPSSLYFPAILAAVLPHGPALTHTANTGAIRGTVVDSTGGGMSGVIIEAVSSTTGTQRKGLSDPGGIYTIGLLPPGTYQLRYSAPGFETAVPAPVAVSV